MEPPKIGDGVLASSSGGEKGLLLFSFFSDFSAVSARVTVRAQRRTGATAGARKTGTRTENDMMRGDLAYIITAKVLREA